MISFLTLLSVSTTLKASAQSNVSLHAYERSRCHMTDHMSHTLDPRARLYAEMGMYT